MKYKDRRNVFYLHLCLFCLHTHVIILFFIFCISSLLLHFPGFLIYFGYGMWHSEERQRRRQGGSNSSSTGEQNKSSGAAGEKDQQSYICQEKTSQF